MFFLLNIQSLRNRSAEFVHYICEAKVDIAVLTETRWNLSTRQLALMLHLLVIAFGTANALMELAGGGGLPF